MKIDRRLNLVLKVELDDGKIIYTHSMPITYETFERYFFVMSQVANQIFNDGIGTMMAPRVAAMMLKRQAEQNGEWEGDEGVEQGLLGEIRRLTNVVVPAEDGGWQALPLDVVERRGLFTNQDIAEVMNAVVFFMLISSINRASQRMVLLNGLTNFWGGSLVSSNVTDFARSLQTSTPVESTGEREIVFSMST